MIRFKKVIIASAVLAAMASVPAGIVYADELTESSVTEITEVSEESAESGAATEESESAEENPVTTVALTEEFAADEEINKYFSDSEYDTDGNATLIKKEKVIYDSEEMQFIAVTTKDGSVFYVLINYSAAGDEDNVFFLNKVDDFDLYALLYAGKNEEDTIDPEAAAEAADKATGNTADEPETESSYEPVATSDKTVTVNSGFNTGTIIIVVVIIAVAAAGAFLFFKSGKKKHETIDFDDTELDIDEE